MQRSMGQRADGTDTVALHDGSISRRSPRERCRQHGRGGHAHAASTRILRGSAADIIVAGAQVQIAVRSQRKRRPDAERARRLPARDARHARAGAVAHGHRRLGAVHSPAIRRVRPHRSVGRGSRCIHASVGVQEMPARWTLGYQQSHRTLNGPDEILRVARTLREKKLPCDSLIYLGTEFTPSGWNTKNGEFTWKTENFPEPAKMMKELPTSISRSCCTSSSRAKRSPAPCAMPARTTRSRVDETPTIAGRLTELRPASGRITRR